MSKISKKSAEIISEKLMKNKYLEVERLETEYLNLLIDLYKGKLPPVLLDNLNDLSPFIRYGGDVYLGIELGGYLNLPQELPRIKNGVLKFDNENNKMLVKFRHKIDNMIDENLGLKEQIKQAIISCNTVNNLKKIFPEAHELYPSITKNEISINMDSIREKLK